MYRGNTHTHRHTYIHTHIHKERKKGHSECVYTNHPSFTLRSLHQWWILQPLLNTLRKAYIFKILIIMKFPKILWKKKWTRVCIQNFSYANIRRISKQDYLIKRYRESWYTIVCRCYFPPRMMCVLTFTHENSIKQIISTVKIKWIFIKQIGYQQWCDQSILHIDPFSMS